MAGFVIENVAIKGISCAVPKNRIETKSFYDKFTKEYVDSFMETTGVRESHRSEEAQTASDLCFVAADNLIREKGIDRAEIGLLVFVTQTPDYRLPATACVLHKRLGLEKSCLAFDVNLGCSGFVYGVSIVGSMMNSMGIDCAMLLNGDTCTKTNSPEDKSEYMLFGDAGTATLLVRDGSSMIDGELLTDGEGFKAIIMPSGAYRNRHGSHERTMWGDGNIRSDYDGYINGTDVFSFTISQVPKMINRMMRENESTPENYDALVLHQANQMIHKQIARKTKFPMEKIPVSIDRYGNTSSASIPLTLCDAYGMSESDDLNRAKGDNKLHLLMCGYGIGLSWGVIDTFISPDDILPIVETSDYYTEGGVSHD